MNIEVYNIQYDTVDDYGVDHRARLTKTGAIPSTAKLFVHPKESLLFDDDLDARILHRIEKDWLVDSFDYVCPPALPRHVECRAREQYGVSLINPPKVEIATPAKVVP